MKALVSNGLIFVGVALVVLLGIRFWPALVYHQSLQDVRTLNRVSPPAADDTVFQELVAMGDELEDMTLTGSLADALRAEPATAFLVRHHDLLQTALAWYRADGAAKLDSPKTASAARIPVLLDGVDPSDIPMGLELLRLHRLLLIYADQSFHTGSPAEGETAVRFSLALSDFLFHRSPMERLYLGDVLLTETLFFLTEVLPRARLTPELTAAIPTRENLDRALLDAFWLRAVVVANFADDPYGTFSAMNPQFNPTQFRVLGGYHRVHTMNMIYTDFQGFQADMNAGLDQVRYDQRLLKAAPSQFFSFNPIGKKMMATAGVLLPPVEEIVVRHGYVTAQADVVRLHAELGTAEWDAQTVQDAVNRLELVNPFTHKPYELNERGTLDLLPPNDRRAQWIQHKAWTMQGVRQPTP